MCLNKHSIFKQLIYKSLQATHLHITEHNINYSMACLQITGANITETSQHTMRYMTFQLESDWHVKLLIDQ